MHVTGCSWHVPKIKPGHGKPMVHFDIETGVDGDNSNRGRNVSFYCKYQSKNRSSLIKYKRTDFLIA